MTDKKELEEGTVFTPKFDDKGLIPCVTTSAKTGKVLMFAWMNEDALKKTIETGEAHYWSRSRAELWHKGASSGMVQSVVEMRTDCDQDCILLSVNVAGTQDTKGSEASCHTGRYSCFYRLIPVQNGSDEDQMKFIDDAKIFNPDDVY